jgi:hypothetical protein
VAGPKVRVVAKARAAGPKVRAPRLKVKVLPLKVRPSSLKVRLCSPKVRVVNPASLDRAARKVAADVAVGVGRAVAVAIAAGRRMAGWEDRPGRTRRVARRARRPLLRSLATRMPARPAGREDTPTWPDTS